MPNLSLTGTAAPLQLSAAQPTPAQQMQLSDLFGQQSAPAPAPQEPGMPVPAQATAPDYGALLQQASERDAALQAASAQYAPNYNENVAALSALSALGNIAGAVTGKGAVGAPALQMAEQLRQESRLQQESFFRRVRQEEEIIKQERAARLKAENDALYAESLRPLIGRVKDPKEQAMLFQSIAAGRLDETRAYLQKYDDIQLSKKYQEESMSMRRAEHAQNMAKGAQEYIKNQQNILKNEVDLAEATGELNALPAKARREVMQKQGKQFQDAIKDDAKIINDYLALDRLVGGFGTEAGRAKLARILGVGGSVRGSWTGSKEDMELFAGINKLFGTMKTKDYGASLTATEKPLLDAGLGFTMGKSMFSNVFVKPETLNSMMAKLGDELGAKLSNAASGIDPAVLKELAKDGLPTKSPDNYAQLRALHRDMGGYAGSLDIPPPELKRAANISNDEWIQMSPIQKLNLIKSFR